MQNKLLLRPSNKSEHGEEVSILMLVLHSKSEYEVVEKDPFSQVILYEPELTAVHSPQTMDIVCIGPAVPLQPVCGYVYQTMPLVMGVMGTGFMQTEMVKPDGSIGLLAAHTPIGSPSVICCITAPVHVVVEYVLA